MCPYCVLPADVEKVEFHRLAVRRHLARHARPVAGVTVVRQHQAVLVHIQHGDRIVGSSSPRHLMHECVTHGSRAQRDLHELSFYVGGGRDRCHMAFPRTRQSFQLVEGLLRVGLRESHGWRATAEQRTAQNEGISCFILLTRSSSSLLLLSARVIRWQRSSSNELVVLSHCCS